MPRVILLNPFVKHYAGSVFDLNEAVYASDWDVDERNLEKQSRFANKVYLLPDAGNSRSAELPVQDTMLCPEEIFININIKNGPCQITAVKEHPIDPETIQLITARFLKVQLEGTLFPFNNNILLLSTGEKKFDTIEIYDSLSNQKIQQFDGFSDTKTINFQEAYPGFYRVLFFNSQMPVLELYLFKNFPLVVSPIKYTNRFQCIPTVW